MQGQLQSFASKVAGVATTAERRGQTLTIRQAKPLAGELPQRSALRLQRERHVGDKSDTTQRR